ncbi:MAG: redoxin family protein [Bacteroidaceae bacterium]|nr:redoxin family protein [Bacteroidaceae bacterium]
MQKIFSTLSALLLMVSAQAQTRVIVNPDYDEQEGSMDHLAKVELTDTATILHINVHCNFGGWMGINNYIEANGKRYALKSGRRIPTMDGKELKEDIELPTLNKAGEKTGVWLIKGGEEPFVEGKPYTNTSQKDSLILHFEPIPADVTVFDVGNSIRNVSLVKTKKEEPIADSHLLVMPDATPEQFLDAIVAMLPGKVVFIDFWATWCGPCKLGIIKMGPVKEELKGKDVVFVYLTDESSPEADWRRSITSMKGYHLRMSSSFWNKLPCFAETKGIPQYYLYDREGRQVWHQVGFSDSVLEAIKAEIGKALE